mgnify:CR=1 FL=1
MTTQNPANLTVEEALKLLQLFSSKQTKLVESASEKALLQQALIRIVDLADYVNFGICAESAAQAFSALESYLNALGYQIPLDRANIPTIEGPAYLKLNTNKQSSYFNSYTGTYRGVLISCQSSVNDSISGIYGHLPLDLFVYGDGILTA